MYVVCMAFLLNREGIEESSDIFPDWDKKGVSFFLAKSM